MPVDAQGGRQAFELVWLAGGRLVSEARRSSEKVAEGSGEGRLVGWEGGVGVGGVGGGCVWPARIVRGLLERLGYFHRSYIVVHWTAESASGPSPERFFGGGEGGRTCDRECRGKHQLAMALTDWRTDWRTVRRKGRHARRKGRGECRRKRSTSKPREASSPSKRTGLVCFRGQSPTILFAGLGRPAPRLQDMSMHIPCGQ